MVALRYFIKSKGMNSIDFLSYCMPEINKIKGGKSRSEQKLGSQHFRS